MSHEFEKAEVDYVPDVELTKTATEATNAWETEFTPEEQRRIVRRVDRRLVVTVGVMYCISLMDRYVSMKLESSHTPSSLVEARPSCTFC